MEVKEVNLSSKSKFMEDYIKGKAKSDGFLDYPVREGDSHFKQRLDDLLTRSFQRDQLADYLIEVHKGLSYEQAAFAQIEKLKNDRSVVVVGGQQAGLLTGPLYTVHKAMSIILLAKQQEEKLNVPVVPIFWVAGEDHDLDEIRFVYKEKNGTWRKHNLYEANGQRSATVAHLNKKELQEWLQQLFATLPETAHTKEIVAKTTAIAMESTTYVDFFIKMMNWFFGKEGLLLLDAHAPAIRKLEISYFEKLILDVEDVQRAQQKGMAAFSEEGYGQPIITERENAHLFLEINEERKRLDYENEKFIVKGTDLTFSKNEILELLHKQPDLFSNNVVTRPLMQEWLLPVLAFVSGPGELLYWGTLKEVFAHFGLKVPPIALRYEATYIPKKIEKWLDESEYCVEDFLEGKMEQLREEWFEAVNKYPVDEVLKTTQLKMNEQHEALRRLAKDIDPTLAVLSEKNMIIIENQLNFLGRKMNHFIRKKHEHELENFTKAGHWLYPADLPQERVIHPILLINQIGIEAFQQFIARNQTFGSGHKLVSLP